MHQVSCQKLSKGSESNCDEQWCCVQVLKAALHLARKHEVTIDSSYAALIVGVCVIVGFATALDPELNLIDAATPAFFISDLTGRIAGRLYA